MDSSSGVRVKKKNASWIAQSGIGGLASNLQIAKVPGA